jgi:hypothetical protein
VVKPRARTRRRGGCHRDGRGAARRPAPERPEVVHRGARRARRRARCVRTRPAALRRCGMRRPRRGREDGSVRRQAAHSPSRVAGAKSPVSPRSR